MAHTEAAYIIQEDQEVLEWTKSFQSELLVLVQHILKLERAVGWGGDSDLVEPLAQYEFDYKYVNYYMNCQVRAEERAWYLIFWLGTNYGPIVFMFECTSYVYPSCK